MSLSAIILLNHTPQVLDIQKHILSQANQIYFHVYADHKTLYLSNTYLSKLWVFKDLFYF